MANPSLPCSPPARGRRSVPHPTSPPIPPSPPLRGLGAGETLPRAPRGSGHCALPRLCVPSLGRARGSLSLWGARSRGPAGRERLAAGGLALPGARGRGWLRAATTSLPFLAFSSLLTPRSSAAAAAPPAPRWSGSSARRTC